MPLDSCFPPYEGQQSRAPTGSGGIVHNTQRASITARNIGMATTGHYLPRLAIRPPENLSVVKGICVTWSQKVLEVLHTTYFTHHFGQIVHQCRIQELLPKFFFFKSAWSFWKPTQSKLWNSKMQNLRKILTHEMIE